MFLLVACNVADREAPEGGDQTDAGSSTSSNAAADASPNPPREVAVDGDGTTHVRSFSLPYSPLASPQAKNAFIESAGKRASTPPSASHWDISEARKRVDETIAKPWVRKWRARYPVTITPVVIGGVQTDVVLPKTGVTKKNENRVLINLHGGGFMLGARYHGQAESIPIASLGGIKVITVDYRMAPEYRFPAASEDVAKVYGALLEDYKPQNIGLYGCSSGGMLAAESVAWFQEHGLPRPGAIGIFGAGALVPMVGDSNYIVSALTGTQPQIEDGAKIVPYFDVPGLNIKDPLVSPAYSESVLSGFPPSLIISGTRSIDLSPAVYTHSKLVKSGVEADLHVWEGMAHCFLIGDDVPEAREAWEVIVDFFDKHLGEQSHR